MDAKTRQIIAFHVGDRSHKSAEHLWAKIPQAYRQHATFYTDQYVVYEKVTGVWRILCIAQIEHKRISVYAKSANPKHTPERISPCSNSLYSIRPHC
jgi:IS1 family transposase